MHGQSRSADRYRRIHPDPTVTKDRKYIVDISGKLPTILCELDASDGSLTDSYVYADAQPLAHHAHGTGGAIDNTYWYIHDRLGSVRQVFEYTAADILNFEHWNFEFV